MYKRNRAQSLVTDMDSIADADARAGCERRALKCGRRLMLEAGTLSIEDVVAVAQEIRAQTAGA